VSILLVGFWPRSIVKLFVIDLSAWIQSKRHHLLGSRLQRWSSTEIWSSR